MLEDPYEYGLAEIEPPSTLIPWVIWALVWGLTIAAALYGLRWA